MRPPENPEIAANLALALRPRGADKGPRVPRARYDLRMLSRIPDEVLGEIDGGRWAGSPHPARLPLARIGPLPPTPANPTTSDNVSQSTTIDNVSKIFNHGVRANLALITNAHVYIRRR
jgi:hypothetical protein